MKRILILGCGHRQQPMLSLFPSEDVEVCTVDKNFNVKPTRFHDLEFFPWPFEENSFDGVEAVEVLEHITGRSGDEIPFFRTFREIYHILKPNGILGATVPWWQGEWSFGDPSHKRIITPGTLVFLDQSEYHKQLDGPPGTRTAMSDFRGIWDGDFQPVAGSFKQNGISFEFRLRAIKPARKFRANAA